MPVEVLDTLSAARAVLSAPAPEREELYRERVLRPLKPMFDALDIPWRADEAGGFDVRAFGNDYFDPSDDPAPNLAALRALEEAGLWQTAAGAIERALDALDARDLNVTCALLLGNHNNKAFMNDSEGLGAFGAVPGFVTVQVWPTSPLLPQVPSVLAHEVNHNVRLRAQPWDMNISLGEYVVMEGLAVAFETELYGPQLNRYASANWTTGQREQARRVIGRALDVRGYFEVRPYIFGGASFGGAPESLPFHAGYVIGLDVVRMYLRETGSSISDATRAPGADIIERSGYFEGV